MSYFIWTDQYVRKHVAIDEDGNYTPDETFLAAVAQHLSTHKFIEETFFRDFPHEHRKTLLHNISVWEAYTANKCDNANMFHIANTAFFTLLDKSITKSLGKLTNPEKLWKYTAAVLDEYKTNTVRECMNILKKKLLNTED